ncbi:hypothetical protein BH09GEM1_BH09GEM1_37630 [soil metagenome]
MTSHSDATAFPILSIPQKFSIGLLRRDPFLEAAGFELPGPGTYTLEGPNGSGKSLFVRMLTGTLPGAVDRNVAPIVEIDGTAVSINSYKDATAAGLSAIFQDDDLISSMTVFEYLLLAHSTTSPRHFAQYAWDILFHGFHLSLFSRVFGAGMPDQVDRAMEFLERPRIDWKDRRALRASATSLFKDHGVDPSILDQIPPRLSGGGKACARIVSAQLHQRTRVLLLDEALNSVERNVWPNFIETIKVWAQSRKAAVLAISHNADELAAWEPRIRFEINDGILRETESFSLGVRRRFSRTAPIAAPVYEMLTHDQTEHASVYKSLWDRIGPVKRVIVLSDEAGGKSQLLSELQRFLPVGVEREMVSVEAGEESAHDRVLERVLQRLSLLSQRDRVAVVVIASKDGRIGVSLSTVLSAHLNIGGVVVVPITFVDALEAILTNTVTFSWTVPGEEPTKVRASTALSPTAYVLNLAALTSADQAGVRDGLVRCLRLGLLFDEHLFHEVAETIASNIVTLEQTSRIFHRAVAVLNQISAVDPSPALLRPLLETGEQHARYISAAMSSSLSDGEALLLGMIMEAVITNSEAVAATLLKVFGDGARRNVSTANNRALWDVYSVALAEESQRSIGSPILSAIALKRVGEFNVSRMRKWLASSRSKTNKNISRFANEMMSAAARRISQYDIQTAIPKTLGHIASLYPDSA